MKKVMELNDSGVKLMVYKDDTQLNPYRLYQKIRGKEPIYIMCAADLGSVLAYLSGFHALRMRPGETIKSVF